LPDALGGQDENNSSIRFKSVQRARRMSEAIEAPRQQTSKTKAILRRCHLNSHCSIATTGSGNLSLERI